MFASKWAKEVKRSLMSDVHVPFNFASADEVAVG
ncbi:unnamed protein product, partial [Rotaria sp. Silwood2]